MLTLSDQVDIACAALCCGPAYLHPCVAPQGRYATLGMVQTPGQWRNLAIVFFVAFVALGGNSAINSIKQTRSDRSRARALQELEKEQ
jgi:hypothetical protein